MSEVKIEEKDPMWATGYNAALEWAANWLTGALGGYSEETVEVLKAQAMTFRAGMKQVQQQDFFDAVRNDPYMTPERKEFWLKKEEQTKGPKALKTRYQYIHFVEVEKKTKTSVWSCRNNRSGEELGQVAWYGAWRQYCYFPTCQAVYSTGCLEDIKSFIGALKEGVR